jgi:hypothetical protein
MRKTMTKTKTKTAQQDDVFLQYGRAIIESNPDVWSELAEEAAPTIDPKTAEVTWWIAERVDPYGFGRDHWGDTKEMMGHIGRVYFARAPGDIWVWFGDLSGAVRDALWKKHRKLALAFPAGLDEREMKKQKTRRISGEIMVRESDVELLKEAFHDRDHPRVGCGGIKRRQCGYVYISVWCDANPEDIRHFAGVGFAAWLEGMMRDGGIDDPPSRAVTFADDKLAAA